MNKKQQAFTLVELMVVVTILGVLAAIALPSFSKVIAKHRVKSQAAEHYSLLGYTRTISLRAGRPAVVKPLQNESWSEGLSAIFFSESYNRISLGKQKSVNVKVMKKSAGGWEELAGSEEVVFTGKGYLELSSELKLVLCSLKYKDVGREIIVLSTGVAVVARSLSEGACG